MDFDEMSKAYNEATKLPSPTVKGGNYGKGDPIVPRPEGDFSILQLGHSYIVSQARFLGSLDYNYVCQCDTHWDAVRIVKALSK